MSWDDSPEVNKDSSPLASRALKDLKAVRSKTGRTDDQRLRHIGRLTGLRALYAAVDQPTGEGIAHCADPANLLDLHLQGAKLTDRAALPHAAIHGAQRTLVLVE